MAEQSTMNGGRKLWIKADYEDKKALQAAVFLDQYCDSHQKKECNGCVFAEIYDGDCPVRWSELSEALHNSEVSICDMDIHEPLDVNVKVVM